MPTIFLNSKTLYLENFLNPQTLDTIWHVLLSGSYGLGFKHGDSFPDRTLGRNVPVELIFILVQHYVKTYTTSKKTKSQAGNVKRNKTWVLH
jgi:hypothetical protein